MQLKRSGALIGVLVAVTLMSAMAWRTCRRTDETSSAARPRVAPHAIAKALAASELFSTYRGGADAVQQGGLRLEGVVVDAEGKPVAGARVGLAGASAHISEIRTEADGWFAINGLAAGGYLLTATRVEAERGTAGYVYYQLGDGTEPAVLVLRPSVTVQVQVRRSGEPVAGAAVAIEGVIGAKGVADERGIYTATGMIPGGVIVRASAPGTAPAMRHAHVPREGAMLQIDLFAATALAGVVVDEAGAPIAGVQLALASPSLAMRDDGVVAVSDVEGAFVAPVMTGEVVRLVATHPEFLRTVSDPVAATEAAARAPVRLVLARGLVLRGRVTDGTGTGVAANVTLYEEPTSEVGRRQRTLRAAADGAFAFTQVQPAAVSLRAESEHGRAELWSAEAVPSEVVTLVLADAGRIAGAVRDLAGAPVEGAKIVAYREESFDLQYGNVVTAVADAEGNYALHGLGAGAYRVAASQPGADIDLREMARAVTAKAGDVGVVLVAEALAEVRGTLAHADGRPVNGLEGLVAQLGNQAVAAAADGTYVLRDVAPGTYSLQVRSHGVIAAFRGEVAVAAPVTELGELLLGATRVLRGTVRDAAGAPVVGALVTAGEGVWLREATLGSLANNDGVAQAWSRSDGTFELTLREFDDTGVRADLAQARSEVVATAGQAHVLLTVREVGTVLGRAVDGRGQVSARAVIALAKGSDEQRVWPGPDGKFALVGYAAGEVMLRFEGEDKGVWVKVVAGQTTSIELRSQE